MSNLIAVFLTFVILSVVGYSEQLRAYFANNQMFLFSLIVSAICFDMWRK